MLEVQSRLSKLYPEYTIAHAPRVLAPHGGGGGGRHGGRGGRGGARHACTDLVANAPVYGDCFQVGDLA